MDIGNSYTDEFEYTTLHNEEAAQVQSFMLGTTESYCLENISDIESNNSVSFDYDANIELNKDGHPLEMSYHVGFDVLQHQESYDQDTAHIDWCGVVILFLISVCFLPFYVIAMIVDMRKNYPELLSIRKSKILFILSTLFFIIFWSAVGIWAGVKQSKMTLVPTAEILFIILFYIVCCLSEAVLKSSFFVRDHKIGTLEEELSKIKIVASVDANLLPVNNSSSPILCCISILELSKKIRQQTVDNKTRLAIRIASIVLSLIFAVVYETSRWVFAANDANKTVSEALIFYIIFSFLLRWTMACFIFHYLGEAVIQLYSRWHQSKWFNALTSKGKSYNYGLPFIQLNTPENIQAWQILRASLLNYYQQPKIFVDVVLSTAFAIWLPLIITSAVIIFINDKIDLALVECLLMSALIFMYIGIAVILASRARGGFNQDGALYTSQLKLAYIDPNHIRNLQCIKILKLLREIILINQDNAIVFRIWGIGINKGFTTVIFSLAVTIFSSLFARIAS